VNGFAAILAGLDLQVFAWGVRKSLQNAMARLA
jgi:hypothetical protein